MLIYDRQAYEEVRDAILAILDVFIDKNIDINESR